MAGDCASAIATSAHPMTSTNSAIAPTNLRERSRMAVSAITSGATRHGRLDLREAIKIAPRPAARHDALPALTPPLYGPRDWTGDDNRGLPRHSCTRDPAVALCRRRVGPGHGFGRRRDAADRVRPFHYRMAAGHGRRASDKRQRVAGGFRK